MSRTRRGSANTRASSVLVRVALDTAGGVTISLRDDGRGFDPSQIGPIYQAGHFGLRQMRERVVDRGGTLDIHSVSGQGAELIITLPPVPQGTNHAAD